MTRKKEYKHHPPLVKNPPEVKNPPKATERTADPDKWKTYGALAVIVLISIIVYLPVFHNGLLAWDDNAYIRDNVLIHSFNLKEIFSHYVEGNWHPITIFTLALEYHLFGLNAAGYHAVNLLLHLLNIVLVFYAVYLLSDKIGVALIASLLFGIHPLHVESVAWAAELKDLLYTFFFLASYIFYLKYLKEQKKEAVAGAAAVTAAATAAATATATATATKIDRQYKFYFLALMLFAFSLLSKAMAASLPLVLILTDYFKGRRINTKTLLEKAPFFLLAFIFGIIAILAQKSTGSILQTTVIPFPDRLAFASYGFINYLFKLLVPLNLCAYYPYPIKNGAVYIPVHYYAYVLLLLFLIAGVIYYLRYSKKIIFGTGFFVVTILLVLQLIPVGRAIMADRYSYLPSIGIFYLIGEGIVFLWNKRQRVAVIALLSVSTLLFSVKTYARCGVWENDLVFWNDVVAQYQTVERAYYNLGVAYMNDKNNAQAINEFNKAIELKPDYSQAYNNRGLVFVNEKRPAEAIKDFNKAIETNPDNANAFNNRGNFYKSEKRNAEAINDFNKAIRLNPDYAEPYNNRGSVYFIEKRIPEALNDFNKAIELSPDNAESWYNRGLVFVLEKRNAEAINDFSSAIKLKPDYVNAYLNRGIGFFNEKRNGEAIKDFDKAIGLKPESANAYAYRGNVFFSEKRNEEALKDYNKAIELNPDNVAAYINRGNLFIEGKRYEEAISNFTMAITLSPGNALAYHKRGISEFYCGKRAAAVVDLKQAVSLGYQPAAEALLKLFR